MTDVTCPYMLKTLKLEMHVRMRSILVGSDGVVKKS